MDLSEAEIVHRDWKLKLRSALISKESLDEARIAADDCCDLGTWLHGEARLTMGKLNSYQDCLEKHSRFHKLAGNVAKAINARQYDEAEALLAASSDYMFASVDLLEAISVLKNEMAP